MSDGGEGFKELVRNGAREIIDEQQSMRDEIIRLIEMQSERMNRMEESINENQNEMKEHKQNHVPSLGTTIAIVGVLMTFIAPIVGATTTMVLQMLFRG